VWANFHWDVTRTRFASVERFAVGPNDKRPLHSQVKLTPLCIPVLGDDPRKRTDEFHERLAPRKTFGNF
jgi:hypothetical protein